MDTDLFGILDGLLGDTEDVLLTAAVVVAIGFFIFMAVRAKFAWAAMVLAAGAAAFVLWVVNNVEFGRDIVDETINPDEAESAPAELVVDPVPAGPQV